MLISMRWGALLGLINVAQIFVLMRERRIDILPPREKEAYGQFFQTGCLLSETQFYRLSEKGEWQTLHEGSKVTIEGAPNEYVYIILEGTVRVHRKGTSVASTTLGHLEKGSWIGERGYLRQFTLPAFQPRDNLTAPSFATVSVASKEARLLRWRREDLQYEMQKDSATNAGVLLSMTRDVVRKLRVQSEQHSDEGLVGLAAADVYLPTKEETANESAGSHNLRTRASVSFEEMGRSLLSAWNKFAVWVSPSKKGSKESSANDRTSDKVGPQGTQTT